MNIDRRINGFVPRSSPALIPSPHHLQKQMPTWCLCSCWTQVIPQILKLQEGEEKKQNRKEKKNPKKQKEEVKF